MSKEYFREQRREREKENEAAKALSLRKGAAYRKKIELEADFELAKKSPLRGWLGIR